MRRFALISLLLLICSQLAVGVPAKRGLRIVCQPDGSSFRARMTGDERAHLIRLEDGCTVIKDPVTGFYCYAAFDNNCRQVSSGVPVGSRDVPGDILLESRNVPKDFYAGRRDSFRSWSDPVALKNADLTQGKKSVKVIIVLCAFADLPFTYTRQDIYNMVNRPGNDAYGATGSVLDYFNDQLGEWYDFKFDVSDIVTVSKGYKYYGEDDRDGQDKHPEEAVLEACTLLDPKIDFSQYDKIYVIYAGGNPADYGADEDHIWPHAQSGLNMTFDGKKFSSYSMSSELMASEGINPGLTLDGIGTICHEFSHTLGLVDYYDTDYEQSGGESDAMYISTALMDGGSYNNGSHTPPGYNAVDYWSLGIGGIRMKQGSNILTPMCKGGDYIIIESAETAGELFLLECRDNSSWDRYIGGRGMLVYHIDKSTRSAGYSSYYEKTLTARQRWTYNEVNCRPDHECAKVVTATPVRLSSEEYTDISGIFFGSKVTSLSDEKWTFWSGETSPYALSSIKRSDDGSVSFIASEAGVSIPITVDAVDVFQDAAIISWTSEGSRRTMNLSCNGTDYEVSPYEDGKYAFTIEGLKPATGYSAVITCMESRAEYGFTTKPMYKGLPVYIYLGSVSKTISGNIKIGSRIPLRLFNAPSCTVEWFWGAKNITPSADGYFTITGNGELRAVVNYSDGTAETIYKFISAK